MANIDEKNDHKYNTVPTSDNINEKNEKQEIKTFGYGIRHIQSFIIFFCLTVTFIARGHLSSTIVAMTDMNEAKESINNTIIKNINMTDSNSTYLCVNGTLIHVNESDFEKDLNITEDICDEFNVNATDVNDDGSWSVYRTYNWSKSVQEMVLGSFFLGYLVMTPGMGLVAQRWGGKIPLQISLFSSGILTLITPWLAVWGGYKAVSIVRVVTGLLQAGTYPSMHTLIAKWVPVCERGRLGTYIYTGSMIGSVLALHVSGFLSASALGWPAVFWTIGVLCLLMAVLLTLFVSPSPQHHKFISEAEKNFILADAEDVVENQSIPWKAIFTSKSVWMGFTAHITTGIIFIFFFTEMPSYLHYIVGLNIQDSGLLSALPYFANFVISVILGNICDYWINDDIFSLRNTRIISNTIAVVCPGICLFALSFITSPTISIILLVIAMGTHGGAHTGWMMTYIDMAPNFSGTLMAIGNTFQNSMAVILPLIISNVVTDVTNIVQWRIMMIIVASIAISGNILFSLFISTDIQPWNNVSYRKADQEDPDTKKS